MGMLGLEFEKPGTVSLVADDMCCCLVPFSCVSELGDYVLLVIVRQSVSSEQRAHVCSESSAFSSWSALVCYGYGIKCQISVAP